MRIKTFLAAIAGLALVTVAACSPPNENPSTETAEPTAEATTEATAEDTATEAADDAEQDAEGLTFSEAVVREKGTDNEMTAIFGELENNTDDEIVISGFTTSLDAPVNELHEVVDGVMQEMESDLVIPTGESHVLEPGGDHFMIMGYPEAIMAGDEVDVTVELADGATVEFPAVPVRTIGAGEENYGADGELSGHEGHEDHGDHEGH